MSSWTMRVLFDDDINVRAMFCKPLRTSLTLWVLRVVSLSTQAYSYECNSHFLSSYYSFVGAAIAHYRGENPFFSFFFFSQIGGWFEIHMNSYMEKNIWSWMLMKHDYPLAFIRDINDKSITSCFGSTWMGYNISFLFLNEILTYIFQMKKRAYLLLKVYP